MHFCAKRAVSPHDFAGFCHWLADLAFAVAADPQLLAEKAEPAGQLRTVCSLAADLPTFLANLADLGFVGGNVTLPHKEKAFAACAVTTPVARRLQAVNTLWIEDEKLFGDNTDVAGFLASLDADIPDWDKSVDKAVVLGAGGAARGIIFALNARGIRNIAVVNRTRSRGEQLQKQFPEVRIDLADFVDLPRLLRDADLLVNTTSLGMIGQPPLDIDLAPLPARAVVADIVYAPLETALLRQASARESAYVGWSRHVAAPGGAGICALVRANSTGDAGLTRAHCRRHRR